MQGNNEVIPLGESRARPIYWKKLYYVDYPMLMKHKTYALDHMDWYIEDNSDKEPKLVKRDTYDGLISALVKYPLKFKRILMPGPWGGFMFRDYLDLPEYLSTNVRLAREAGITCWSNVETFDRDTPTKFPPIDWRKLEFKIDATRETGVDKLITFEFSHFMSPNSVYPAAHQLFRRYCERFGLEVELP